MTTDLQDHDYRLPTAVEPRRYELLISPDLEAAVFTGSVRIEIDVVSEVSAVVLNACELEIREATIARGWSSGSGSNAPSSCAVVFDEPNERVTFTPAEPLPTGQYTLAVAFSGILNDKLCGFYRSTFLDENGVERVVATTQFEETDARRAFPCFDEPDKKAVYSITIDAPGDLMAISNGPEIGVEELADGRRRIQFGDTIAMSTYLVAFVVGPLVATDPVDVDGVALRVITVPGKLGLTAHAADAGAHALKFFSDYFAIPYPGEKLDLIALPDFAAGAMENLGCVTFREAILLADPDNAARSEIQRLAEVVEHEIAHMWFGDLVTMGWWNGIWLNEAFATFMALCCQNNFRPEWKSFDAFSRSKSSALAVDGLHATRPIEFPVRHPDEAAAMFDVLTYEKGASVLWMLETFLGRPAFRAGVRRYLAAHLYGNTETTDLWDAIEQEAGDLPIRALMDSWIFQGGYPLISASAVADSGGVEHVEIAQSPFSYLPRSAVAESSIGSDWIIPIIAAPLDARVSDERLLLGSTPEQFAGDPTSLVINAGGSGFFRVAYDDRMSTATQQHLSDLQANERYNFVSDTWAVALARRTPLDQFFGVLGRLEDETDPHVWSVVVGALSLIDLVASPDDRAQLAAYCRKLLSPQLARTGWDAVPGEDEQTPLLRSSLISTLGTIGRDAEVMTTARARFDADHQGGTPVDADLAAAILGVVASVAERADFDAILDRYRNPQSPMDEVRHLNALAALTDLELAAEVHELCLTEIRSQNAPYLLSGMLRNRAIGAATFAFIELHFDEMLARFPQNSIHRMLDGVSGLAQLDDAGNPEFADAVRAFCDTRVDGARRKLVTQSLERLEVNIGLAHVVAVSLAGLTGS